MGIVIGIIVVLAIAAFFAVLTCRSKKSDLFKWVGIALFIAFCLTWVVPYGYFNAGTFAEYGMNRLGLSDVPTIMYYAVYFCLTTLLYLFVVGGFYGVISKTKSYEALVNKFAKSVKGHEVLTTIIMIVCIVALTSITKTSLALVVFLPFLVTVLLNAKYDKLTATGVTFGSLLVGMLGATYGTDGLNYFNSYLGTELSLGFWYRLIIGGVALILYVLYNIYRTNKYVKNNKKSEAADDLFLVEESKSKGKMWPTIVIFSVILVFTLLGYIAWNTNWNVGIFDKFHELLITFAPFKSGGEDFTILGYILGANSAAFGMMEISVMIIFLLIITVIVGLMSKMSFEDFLNNFGDGFKKMFKPVCLYALAYASFVTIYMSPSSAYLSNWALTLTKNFNPYITTITSFVTSIFHADLGYTGYLVGTILTTSFADNLAVAHTIYVTTYGLVQVFMPTSALLLVALSYMKIDYKSWFKYIWKFAVAMIIVLLILVTFIVYVF